LKNNVLHDPDTRPVPIFLPAQATNGLPLPVLYYLPGYGNSAAKILFQLQHLAQVHAKVADEGTPVILVVADGWTRWGGGQFFEFTRAG